FGDGDSSASKNPVHTYSQSGTYTIVLLARRCKDVDSFSMQVASGAVSISSFPAEQDYLILYPNPAKGSVTVKALDLIEEIRIFSSSGQIVFVQKEGIS